MSAYNSPSKSTPRRVLGNLPPKALNSPSKQTHHFDASEAIRAQSPLKQVTTLSPQLRADKENTHTHAIGAFAGRKRSIYEVDDAENIEITQTMFGAREQAARGQTAALTAAAMQNYANLTTTVDLAPPGSPTERNTPSPEPEGLHAIDNSQDTQGSQFSISNYFDLAGAGASQPDPVEEEQPLIEEEKKKSRAELLRTRLRFGYYKLETNQVAKRGAEVISTWESVCASSSVDASMSTSLPLASSTESAASHTGASGALSPKRRHDPQPVFVKANLDPFRPIGKLTPAPVLLPTAVSSRLTYDYQMHSSPPHAAVSPEQLMSPVRQRADHQTPVPKRIRVDGDGDVEEEEEEREMVRPRLQARFQEGDLTSSAVKGRAATGLLKLSHGVS